MEHGDDGQHTVPFGKSERVSQARPHGVQIDRAVTVDHALGVAGRTARVAHRRGRLLVHLGPPERVGPGGEQLLITVHLTARSGQRTCTRDGLARGRAGDDHVPDGRRVRQHLRQQRDERGVHDHHKVVRVGRDVADLGRAEPDVERVQDRAHGRHGQIRLEVLGVVPHERGHPLITVHAEPPQRVGEPRGPAGHLGVGPPPDALPGIRHDLFAAKGCGAVPHDRRDRQWDIHHRAAHGPPPREFARRPGRTARSRSCFADIPIGRRGCTMGSPQ